MEIAGELLPRRLLLGSGASSSWRRFPKFRWLRQDIEFAGVAGIAQQRGAGGWMPPQPVERSCGRFKGEFGEMLFKLY